MFRKVLIMIGGLLTILWGVGHIFPTNSVVIGFGNLTIDNRYIILMEWINEGLTLIFIGILNLLITVLTKENNKTLKIVYSSSAVMLFSMAILSLFTGFNVNFIAFKLCPIIFSVSGILILQGVFRK
jgi:hypothetical protein